MAAHYWKIALIMGRLLFIGGGARSGKSRFALDTALRQGKRRLFIATAEPFDDEMAERIRRHQHERHGEFDTVEAPLEVASAVSAAREYDVILIDCLTLFLSNHLLRGDSLERLEERVTDMIDVIQHASNTIIVVTNEVGMGLVPETSLGRRFRDVTGRAHQQLARQADEVYLAALGQILRIKPNPVVSMG